MLLAERMPDEQTSNYDDFSIQPTRAHKESVIFLVSC